LSKLRNCTRKLKKLVTRNWRPPLRSEDEELISCPIIPYATPQTRTSHEKIGCASPWHIYKASALCQITHNPCSSQSIQFSVGWQWNKVLSRYCGNFCIMTIKNPLQTWVHWRRDSTNWVRLCLLWHLLLLWCVYAAHSLPQTTMLPNSRSPIDTYLCLISSAAT